MNTTLVHEKEQEYTVAGHRSPITKETFVTTAKLDSKSVKDSVESETFDQIALGQLSGFCATENAQKLQNDVNKHKYLLGSFVCSDWNFMKDIMTTKETFF